MNALAKLDQAIVLLQQASTLNEVTHIRNMAKAAQEYARAEKKGEEAIRYANGIKLLAARKAGEMLQSMRERGELARQSDPRKARNRTSFGVPPPEPDPVLTLADIGIAEKESQRWVKLADLPEPLFEEGVANGMSETALARGVTVAPARRPNVPMGSKHRSSLTARRRLQKLADALSGYAAALPKLDLRGEEVSDLLDELWEHSNELRRAIKQLREVSA